MERINDNAYIVQLSGDYVVSATVSVLDVSPHVKDKPLKNLRSNSIQQGDDDGDQSSSSLAKS